MAHRPTVRVQHDAELVREARKILGARSNREAVELTITLALTIRVSALGSTVAEQPSGEERARLEGWIEWARTAISEEDPLLSSFDIAPTVPTPRA